MLSNLGDFSAPQSLSFWLSMIWQLPVMMDFAPVHPKHPFRSMEATKETPSENGKKRWEPSTWLHKWFPWKVLYLQWDRSIASGFDEKIWKVHFCAPDLPNKTLWSTETTTRPNGLPLAMTSRTKLASLLGILIEKYPQESQEISSLLGSARAGQLVIWCRWPEVPGCYALFHARDFNAHNW